MEIKGLAEARNAEEAQIAIFLSGLNTSVDTLYADGNGNQFMIRQRALWDAIESSGFRGQVLAAWRAEAYAS